MKKSWTVVAVLAAAGIFLAGCSAKQNPVEAKKTIVVTYSVLGSLVQDLVGDQFEVVVPMPNGLDPHEWEPSARDIETINKATLIVRNGLGLEGGMEGVLEQAEKAGVAMFTASQHIAIRTVKAGQGLPTGDPDQAEGAEDPHLWMDPLRMKAVVLALAEDLKGRFGVDASTKAQELGARLGALDAQVRGRIAEVPVERRLLVTGHESLGYFAEAYDLTLVGAIIPSLSDRAEVSAADMAQLKKTIQARQVGVIFTELGTPPKVAEALGQETNLRVVEITTHTLPDDGSYFTFFEALADTLIRNLQEGAAPAGQ